MSVYTKRRLERLPVTQHWSMVFDYVVGQIAVDILWIGWILRIPSFGPVSFECLQSIFQCGHVHTRTISTAVSLNHVSNIRWSQVATDLAANLRDGVGVQFFISTMRIGGVVFGIQEQVPRLQSLLLQRMINLCEHWVFFVQVLIFTTCPC